MYAVFIDLEKVYDRVDWEALWDVLRIYGVGGRLLAKDKNVYAVFIDLEKVYDRVDWEALWDVMRIYGVGGRLLDGVRAIYRCQCLCQN